MAKEDLEIRIHTKLHDKLEILLDYMNHGLIERKEIVRMTLLTALSGHHILLIGPPGTAKSMIARKLQHVFRDATFFEHLLTRFSVPEELFGPLSIKKLEEDEYIRKISGYLPTASVAFIDEIFKANSAILNALLTLLNERLFDQGSERIKTPLISVIAASNELPEGEELQALYDRFLVRIHVPPVSNEGFLSLLQLSGDPMPEPDEAHQLEPLDLKEIQEVIKEIKVSQRIQKVLLELKQELDDKGIYISDRRWLQALTLLKTSAYTCGRVSVSIWDCLLLEHCLWNEPDEKEVISSWMYEHLGVELPTNTSELKKLIIAYEKLLKRESTVKIQKTNADGKLLYLNSKGEETTKESSQKVVNGVLYYLYPIQSNIRDRTNGGKGVTERDLQNFARNSYSNRLINHNNRNIQFSSYINDPNNYFMIENKPLMEALKYSQAHIDARVREIQNLSKKFTHELNEIDANIKSIETEFKEHLWIDTRESQKFLNHLKQHHSELMKWQQRIKALEHGFSKLPQEDTLS